MNKLMNPITNPIITKTMINEQDFNNAVDSPTIASITLSGMLFGRFVEENINDLQDDYLDYMNEEEEEGDQKISFPQYCYTVFNKVAIESYLDSIKDGLRSNS